MEKIVCVYKLIRCRNIVSTDPEQYTWWIESSAGFIASNHYFLSVKETYEDALKNTKMLLSNVEYKFDDSWKTI